jgi:hypothetical protein
MKIIAFCGFIGSGKDTSADIICREKKAQKISFADALKDAVSVVFGWDRALLQGDTHESRKWRETVDEWWSARLAIPQLTPRYILQHWGTNILRNHFHQDIWLASVERKIMMCAVDTIVITDCRFPNEIEMIRRLGGKIVWIQRGALPEWYTLFKENGVLPAGVHPSEYTWLNTEFDTIIDNSGTIDELREKIFT